MAILDPQETWTSEAIMSKAELDRLERDVESARLRVSGYSE